MKSKFYVTAFLLLLFAEFVYSQNWQEIKSVEEVCSAYPEVMEKMLGQFNLDYPGLEKVKTSLEAGELVDACTQLLQHYENSKNALHLRTEQPVESDKKEAVADSVLKNVFVIQNVKGELPVDEDGHRDWYYKGPNNDSEWAWLSNRHSQINHVFDVYLETGNPKYAQFIDLFLRDFIIKSMPYPAQRSITSVWRGLEVSFRAKVWSRIFYGLLNNNHLTPATRLLILSSLPDHAHYNRNFHGGNNWLTMEISALATVAANFPEYRNAEEWLSYSVEAMTESMKDQVYPDGVQTELTSHYHNVSLTNFEQFKDICDSANRELPPFFNQTLEKMYYYISHAARPDGYRILNNDGDRGSDRELILKGAAIYNKPEWEYIATNGGSGVKPADGPSWFFPWAGHLISRSGYDKDAHWSFFDIGPWGSGHQHNDKLHVSIAAFGRDLLVDAGRFAYTGEVAEKYRPYAKGSQSHNVLLIDGRGQGPGPTHAEEPVSKRHWLITEEYDLAWNSFDSFDSLVGKCTHTRRLFYARGDLWVVVDEIETDLPRNIEALWHWHPQCKVAANGINVTTQNERGNLLIIPVGEQDWEVSFVKGQEDPEMQGWYSEEYNKYEPNTASVYSTHIKSDSKFIWVLFPSENIAEGVIAEIINETPKEIKIRVATKENDEWVVSVPLSK